MIRDKIYITHILDVLNTLLFYALVLLLFLILIQFYGGGSVFYLLTTILIVFLVLFMIAPLIPDLIDKYKKLLNFLNISNSQSLPILKLKNEDINEAKNLLLNSGYDYKNKLIGINCTAAFGDAKCWPKERYKELITKFLEQNYKVIFFSEKKDDFFSDLSILNFQGNTNLSQLIHLINECSLFISNDSGPMHIASSLKRPLIAIFGSTCDIRTGPYNGYVIKKNVSCSPCFKRKCPIDFRCMKNISVKEVFEKSVEILNV